MLRDPRLRVPLSTLSRGRRVAPRICAALVWSFVLACAAPSQTFPHAGVEGHVFAGNENSPVRGATVTLEDSRGATRKTAFTDSQGTFGFADIPPGAYTIRVSHADFEVKTLRFDFFGESDVSLNIGLAPKGSGLASASPATIPLWALQIPPKANREYAAGLKTFREGKLKESVPHFLAAVELYPRFATAYAALGASYQGLGDAEAAANAFRTGLDIDGNQPAACLGLGSILRTKKKYAEAELPLLRAAALMPGDWRVWYELGELYFEAGQLPRAEETLGRARQLHQDFPRVFLLLINALALQEKHPETLAAMDDYLKHFPGHTFAAQVRQKREKLREYVRLAASSVPK